MALAFTIDGPPQPKERPRVGRGGNVYTPTTTKKYEARVHGRALEAMIKHIRVDGGEWPLTAQYAVHVDVYWPDKRARDIDNAAKSILDGCNGALWNDDKQVCALGIVRHAPDSKRPRAEVRVEVVER